MAEIFLLSDLYCIPGALGLGIVEAIYWGLPVLTMNVKHGPEFYYLKNGFNSFIARDRKEMELMLDELIFNDEKRLSLSKNAKQIYNSEASLERMFEGFILQLERFYKVQY
jgi:glycosyltransferase involved in cell wall biosynthesis